MRIWTDGACAVSTGRGGWAWACEDGNEGYGSSPQTTNNRMEMTAALEALRSAPGVPVTIISDSRILIDCFNKEWWRKWAAVEWIGRPNADLWQELLAVVHDRKHPTDWKWVRGHSGEPMNEYVDRLAALASRRA